jgi:hypothetical protein
MKHYRFTGILFCTVLAFFLASCNESEQTTSTDADSTNVESTSTEATMEANTIINTPQTIMIVTHKVSDFAKWKASYDEHDSMRLVHGIHSYVIGRGVEDPNMVMVAVKADDMAKAKAFAKDPSLKKAMQKGGVTGTPSISLITATWQDTAVLGPDIIRSKTTFTVKDWDAWQKGFADGKQERLDNGITDRVYGYDPDDNKKVSLVTAVMDTAKAFAYYNSDALKKRREAGGVTSEPKRFLFRVVQRY